MVSISAHDDKVIVHGGDGGNGKFLADIAVLDMTQPTLAWTVPTTSGTAPSGRLAHTGKAAKFLFFKSILFELFLDSPHTYPQLICPCIAIMVGSQMFIMYGQTGPSSLDNGVYALDTTTWTWQTTYTPTNLNYTNTGLIPAPPPGSNEPSTQNSGNGLDNSNGSNSNTSGNSGSNNSNGGGGNGSGTGSGGGSGGGGNKATNTGAIIGGSVGGVALVLILAALAAFAWLRTRKRKGEPQKTSVYPLPGTDSHRAYFSSNPYDSAPPYYQQNAAPWNNGQKTSLSLHNDSSGEFGSSAATNGGSHPLPVPMSSPTAFYHDTSAQKPNTPIEFQKPNAGD